MSDLDRLFEAANEAMAFSYSPYSEFPVGAAIRGDDGQIYKGANIENVAFPQSWCAETTAIGHMVMGGATKIRDIVVVANRLPLCPPCGGCRQKIKEFADEKTRIHLCDENGIAKTLTMEELLPGGFEFEGFK